MIKIGIVGCGSISVMHTQSIACLEGVQLTCVCDIIKEKANQTAKQYNCKAYYDYEEMLSCQKLDAVHICLPHFLHVPVAKFAFNKGVHVLSEKPMSIGYREAEEAVWLAEEKKLQYGVIFQCRYNAASKLIKRYLTDGVLGRILSARVVLTWHRPASYYIDSNWKGTWEKEGGGVIIDQAIHSIDLANWFIDSEIDNVQMSMHNRRHPEIEVEDCAEGIVHYKNATELSVYAMNYYGGDDPIEIRLLCEKGRATMSYDQATINLDSGEQIVSRKDSAEFEFFGGKPYWGFKHFEQIHNFYQALRSEETLEISGQEALKVQKLVCQMYSQAKKPSGLNFGGK